MKVLLTVKWVGLRGQVKDGRHPETSHTLRLRAHGEESQLTVGTVGEGSPSRYCHLRGMKLLTQVPCQNRRRLGRNTLTYVFCQFLPSVKPKQQPPWPCHPGDAVLGD